MTPPVDNIFRHSYLVVITTGLVWYNMEAYNHADLFICIRSLRWYPLLV